MLLRRVVMTVVLLLGVSAAAHAEILAAGSLFGGSTQNNAACYVFNASGGPVQIQSNQILRQDGTNLALTSDNCAFLAPGASCAIAANIITTQAHSCKMVITPSAADVRGTFDIRVGGTVLQSLELR